MAAEKALAKYTASDGEEIVITPQFIKQYICQNENMTNQEMAMYAHVCKAQGVNPLSREIHLIKYGSNPAQTVIGKDFWLRVAHEDKNFAGISAGVTVAVPDKWNEQGKPTHASLERREGSLVGEREKLVGGWCKVFVKGKEVPFFDEVSFAEYSTGRALWKTKPATMIRKVALAHAMREAFPKKFNSLYCEEELQQAEPVKVENEPCEVVAEQFQGAEIEEF